MAPHVLPLAAVVERLLGEEFARQAALALREIAPILVHMGARHDAVSLAELYRLLSDRTHPEAILRRLFGQVDRETLKALERRVPTLAIPAVVSSGSQLAEQWIKRNANLIKVEPAIQRAIRKVLEEPLHQGVRVEAVKKRLQERFEIEERRAQLIARDQTLKLAGQLQEARQTQAGIRRYVWTTSDDERVRPDHAALDGTIQEWDNPPIVDKRTGRRAHPGGDYQCLPGNSKILFADSIQRAFRRRYRGELTLLITDAGETLECTPNHPILTSAGWLPVERVQIGDYVFKASERGAQFFETDIENRQPCIADIFQAFARLFGFRRERAIAAQFHGDCIVDEQIEIVDVQRRLRPHDEAAFAQCIRELDLADPDASRLGLREADLLLFGQGLPSDGVVRGLRLRLAQFFGRIGEAREIGRTAPAHNSAGAFGDCAHARATNTETLAQRFDRGTLDIETQAEILVEWLRVVRQTVKRARGMAPSADCAAEIVFGAIEGERNLAPSFAFCAQPQRIIDKRICVFSGHVYNLSTECEWYVAQNLCVHNCRCTADPVLDDDTPQIPEGAPAPDFTLPEVETQLLQPEPDFTPAFEPPPPRQAPEPVPVALQGVPIGGDAERTLREAALRGLADFAPARVPLAGFQVVGESATLGEGIGGHYSLQRKTLTISTSPKNLGNVVQSIDVAKRSGLTPKLAAKPFGARYANMLENVANIAATPAKAVEITTTHEYAHHLHLATLPKGGPAEMLIRRAYFGPDATGAEDFREASSWRGRQPVSAYGDANLAEFWAEAVAAYRHLPRAWLEEHAPTTLAMVEAVLKLL